MKTVKKSIKAALTAAPLVLALLMIPQAALAHCDRVNGPVATDAREALKSGRIEPVAIWVGQEEMGELRNVFQQSLAAYKMGGDAREVAEQYFMSTAVRLHRMAEGFPFTGLKPAQPMPKDISLAEKALETGELQPVTDFLAREMQNQTGRLFRQALEKRKEKGSDVAAGREWADAYVQYIIFVHDLYKRISSGAPHGIGH